MHEATLQRRPCNRPPAPGAYPRRCISFRETKAAGWQSAPDRPLGRSRFPGSAPASRTLPRLPEPYRAEIGSWGEIEVDAVFPAGFNFASQIGKLRIAIFFGN